MDLVEDRTFDGEIFEFIVLFKRSLGLLRVWTSRLCLCLVGHNVGYKRSDRTSTEEVLYNM